MPQKNWNDVGPVTLIGRPDETRVYDGLDDLCEDVGYYFIDSYVSDHKLETECLGFSWWSRGYYVRDEAGLIVPRWKLLEVASAYQYRVYRTGRLYYYRESSWDREKDFRNGPVPGTGKRGHYSGFRHPRTYQESRENQEWDVRPKRKPKNLPSVYDDYHRSDLRDRCWKRFRRTQYKT